MIQALCFHAEALHDDWVWHRLETILKIMAWRGSRATFFIYPFRAHVAGRDISVRVQMLQSLGHEIGQHTHFYSGTVIDKPNKSNDLSDQNVRRCVQRDHEWLSRHAKPKGFTAGAWLVSDAVYEILADLGFEYDCSARVPDLCTRNRPPSTLWLTETQTLLVRDRPLLLMPTTHLLRDRIFWRRYNSFPLNGNRRYQLIYLHDHDLLRWPIYAGLAWHLAGRTIFCSAQELTRVLKD